MRRTVLMALIAGMIVAGCNPGAHPRPQSEQARPFLADSFSGKSRFSPLLFSPICDNLYKRFEEAAKNPLRAWGISTVGRTNSSYYNPIG